jgi:hypothetical protein
MWGYRHSARERHREIDHSLRYVHVHLVEPNKAESRSCETDWSRHVANRRRRRDCHGFGSGL